MEISQFERVCMARLSRIDVLVIDD